MASLALAAPQDGAEFGDWKASCKAGDDELPGGCHIFQHIKVKESGKTLLHVAVGYRKDSSEPFAMFTLPLGIALPPGLLFKVAEGEPQKLVVAICVQQGCQAPLKLSGELLAAMKGAEQATLTFVGPDAKAYNIPVSLKGFGKGFDSLAP
jgi:invasion protein IalB